MLKRVISILNIKIPLQLTFEVHFGLNAVNNIFILGVHHQ